ncbi:MAG: phosphodiester glycosidase family protein, partial [Anaerolineales bacterium]
PRTTAGVDKKGHTLIFVIVDGRQSGYSKGITLIEIAQILIENGVKVPSNWMAVGQAPWW